MYLTSDDIEESYKHLRRLVMDYLGISIPSFESEAGDVMETKDTENAPTGTQLGTRTWSRPSIPDSMSQQYTRGKTTQSPSLSGRGILVIKLRKPSDQERAYNFAVRMGIHALVNKKNARK